MSATTTLGAPGAVPVPEGSIIRRLLRPAVGFNHPTDVLKDDFLDPEEKRAVLCSWACDANAPPSKPTLRRLPGSDDAVPLSEILAALRRLDV
jgi:hypothetical protein